MPSKWDWLKLCCRKRIHILLWNTMAIPLHSVWKSNHGISCFEIQIKLDLNISGASFWYAQSILFNMKTVWPFQFSSFVHLALFTSLGMFVTRFRQHTHCHWTWNSFFSIEKRARPSDFLIKTYMNMNMNISA